jgi:polysaccharide deacetylase family protein (PEP-CTERM system associated)
MLGSRARPPRLGILEIRCMGKEAHYILSVDVEDYFQVEAFTGQVSRDDWDRWPSRVVANTHRALDLCDASGTKATYFVLGWVARKFPALVREIHARGHELACHSFWHRPVCSLTPDSFREDLRQSCDAIAQASGVRVIGYRAPSWSITAESLWAFDVLAEEGFVYDASIFPIRHDLYGYAGGQRFPHRVVTAKGPELTEFPSATVRIFGSNVPTGGGGYLRILPFSFTRWALRRLAREDGRAIVVYFHPWELDPEQPRIAAPLKSRLRHYTNLGRMEQRLRRLMATHSFQPFRDLVEQPIAQ